MLTFIHIGKTGGSTVQKLLNIKQYHLNKNYDFKNKFIIWIRNPIARFVSAFNMSYINVNFRKYIKNTNNLEPRSVLLKKKIDRYLSKETDYIFSTRYDELINFFKTANNLAEGLSSNNNNIRKKAEELMNNPLEHINKGIGWYLNNGRFVRNRNSNIIFVGRQETMDEDLQKLGIILDKEIKNDETRINHYSSKESKYLSPLAIENIKNYYKNSDYAALIELNKHGWISDETLDSYYIYP
jgi:hypothetical protein